MMKDMEVPQVPAWAAANKPRVADFLGILDRELAGREFAAGDRLSVADITGLVAIDFMKPARLALPEPCANVRRWHAGLAARPSASA
jgi:glutathione S-transferase